MTAMAISAGVLLPKRKPRAPLNDLQIKLFQLFLGGRQAAYSLETQGSRVDRS
jgi:hypothetical protein